ncbi:MAG: magnesium transporter [Verrucomicrobia bacterium]|nr:MAG: magnesium transporter [Verrucomicrobiota bacterium]
MITVLVYRDHRFALLNPPLAALETLRAEPGVIVWVDLSAPTPEESTAIMEGVFALHPVVMKDCTSDTPFPKIDPFDHYLHLVMHAVDYSKTDKFTTTDLDLVLGKNFLLTFHRQPLRLMQQVLERYGRSVPGAAPVRGPDRFAHTLLDQLAEGYKPALAELRQDLEAIEDAVLGRASPTELFPQIVALRKDLANLRQIVRPQRAVAAELALGKPGLIRPVMLPYLRDLAEDFARIESQAAAWGDQLLLGFRVYLNKSSHQANEGIKVLTGLTALTMPPILIGGWFGMNIDGMAELTPMWAYPAAALVTLAATGALFIFLRRRRWL